jgi:hypothetical protein
MVVAVVLTAFIWVTIVAVVGVFCVVMVVLMVVMMVVVMMVIVVVVVVVVGVTVMKEPPQPLLTPSPLPTPPIPLWHPSSPPLSQHHLQYFTIIMIPLQPKQY